VKRRQGGEEERGEQKDQKIRKGENGRRERPDSGPTPLTAS
jgi:hypothetical protein